MKRFTVLVVAVFVLLGWPLTVTAEETCASEACKALRDGTGASPGAPTDDLICFVYPEVPRGTRLWLQMRSVDGDGKRTPVPGWETPRMKIAGTDRNATTRICIGRHHVEGADEAYLCSEFPDKSQWFSARRREEAGGTGVYERALGSFPRGEMSMCLGPGCLKLSAKK
jgi:hypothetical protein